ncbi:adenylosuccinate lyase [Fusarium pseudoanthophilum]|uniref:Adenylosuccinate lyase n=1 Tax=Fusarium pseudoanthophilum TaxID=48495 RepID=A0A8H5PMJ0_9HYPO|nr:adenylosuccinate lyase [Fusarium pseudoanthophilum]
MQFSIIAAIIAATIGKYPDAVRSEKPATRSFFYVGGRYDDDGDGGHVFRDQMYVEKLAPVNGAWKDTPIVMIHGMAQTGTNFLNKPDGGVGWASRFIQQGYEVYIVDQTFRGRSAWMPGQGAAKLSTLSAEAVEVAFTDSRTHMLWPQAVNHTQWPGSGVRGDPVFDAFYSSNVEFVDNTTYQQTSVQAAGAALLDRIGKPAVLLGHSQGSFMPTLIADLRPELTKSIVLLEAAGPPFKDEIFKFGGEFPRPWGLWDVPITYNPPVKDPKKDLVQKVHAQKDSLSTECILQADEPSPRKLVNLADIPILIVTDKRDVRRRIILSWELLSSVNTKIELRYLSPDPHHKHHSAKRNSIQERAPTRQIYIFAVLDLRESLSNHVSHPFSPPLQPYPYVRNRPCEMEELFSRESRYTIWRILWLWLAQSQKELGIVYRVPNPDDDAFIEERIIEDEAIEQLRRCCNVLPTQASARHMRGLASRHVLDLRAQYHFVTGLDATRSKHWLNLGVTHEYVLENTEQILMARAVDILNTKIAMLLYRLGNFAMDHRDVHCLVYKPDTGTPYLTTVGERISGWAKMFVTLLRDLQILRRNIASAGSQPITSSEEHKISFFGKLSMLQHFEGDQSKCEKLNDLLRRKMGFESCRAKDYSDYRCDINALLGRLCTNLGDTALQIVKYLDHFDSTGQLVEKRASNDGSPVTAQDPAHKQSWILKIAAETLKEVADDFKNPSVSKIYGREEYIMARLFKHAARVVRILQSIVEGLYYDAQGAYIIKWVEMPSMMTSPLVGRLTHRYEDPTTIMRHLDTVCIDEDAMNHPFQLRVGRFIIRLLSHEFFRRHPDDVRNAVLSVLDISQSLILVDEICGQNGIIAMTLQPYREYIREMTAGEARLQPPLMIQAAPGH